MAYSGEAPEPTGGFVPIEAAEAAREGGIHITPKEVVIGSLTAMGLALSVFGIVRQIRHREQNQEPNS